MAKIACAADEIRSLTPHEIKTIPQASATSSTLIVIYVSDEVLGMAV